MKRCEMERIGQMKEFLEFKKDFLIKERINKMKCIFIENIDNKRGELENVLREMLPDGNKGKLVIAYLRSSYILNSHEFYVAYYEGEAFVEENPASTYLNLNPVFAEIDEDLQEIDQTLHKKFIRVFAGEREEVHRWYIEQIYIQFVHVIKAVIEKISEGKKIEIYYGGYMDALELVIRI